MSKDAGDVLLKVVEAMKDICTAISALEPGPDSIHLASAKDQVRDAYDDLMRSEVNE